MRGLSPKMACPLAAAAAVYISLLSNIFVGPVLASTGDSDGATSSTLGEAIYLARPVSAISRLYARLFVNYEKELRPVVNESHALQVRIKFWLKQILKVDERDQTLNVYCWLEFYWRDELLHWDPAEYDGVERIHVPSSRIWKPDIMVYNNAKMNMRESEMETNAVVTFDGRVLLFRSMITDITCNLDLRLFPFDQQACYLTFASWSMDGSKIRLLVADDANSSLELYTRNAEWTLTDFRIKSYKKKYECCPHPFADVTYFIVIQRSPTYYIFSLVIPSAFITVVTIVGFFTPHSTTGENTEKVSLGVTALLSMAIIMMMVSDEVPATSEVIPLIGKYYIGLICLIFMAAFTTTVTLAFQMRGNVGIDVKTTFAYSLARFVERHPTLCWFFSFPTAPRKSAKRKKLDEDTEDTANSIRSKNRYRRRCNNQRSGRSKSDSVATTFSQDGVNLQIVHWLPEGVERPNPDLAKLGLSSSVSMCSFRGAEQTPLLREEDDAATEDEDRTPQNSDLFGVLSSVRHSVSLLERAVEEDRLNFDRRSEWQRVTRVLERVVMSLYIMLAFLFATHMLLLARQDPIQLTDETCDRLKT